MLCSCCFYYSSSFYISCEGIEEKMWYKLALRVAAARSLFPGSRASKTWTNISSKERDQVSHLSYTVQFVQQLCSASIVINHTAGMSQCYAQWRCAMQNQRITLSLRASHTRRPIFRALLNTAIVSKSLPDASCPPCLISANETHLVAIDPSTFEIQPLTSVNVWYPIAHVETDLIFWVDEMGNKIKQMNVNSSDKTVTMRLRGFSVSGMALGWITYRLYMCSSTQIRDIAWFSSDGQNGILSFGNCLQRMVVDPFAGYVRCVSRSQAFSISWRVMERNIGEICEMYL